MHYSVRIFLTKGVFVVNFCTGVCGTSLLGRRGGEKVKATKMSGFKVYWRGLWQSRHIFYQRLLIILWRILHSLEVDLQFIIIRMVYLPTCNPLYVWPFELTAWSVEQTSCTYCRYRFISYLLSGLTFYTATRGQTWSWFWGPYTLVDRPCLGSGGHTHSWTDLALVLGAMDTLVDRPCIGSGISLYICMKGSGMYTVDAISLAVPSAEHPPAWEQWKECSLACGVTITLMIIQSPSVSVSPEPRLWEHICRKEYLSQISNPQSFRQSLTHC
jgi:hypothetical protein